LPYYEEKHSEVAIFRQQVPTCCLNIGGILKTYSQISNLKGKKKKKNTSHKIQTLVTTKGQLLQHMSAPK
jgi:hypothetical protein